MNEEKIVWSVDVLNKIQRQTCGKDGNTFTLKLTKAEVELLMRLLEMDAMCDMFCP